MPDKNILAFDEFFSPSDDGLIYYAHDPGGTPIEYKLPLRRIVAPIRPQMRLTLESGVPVSTSDQTAKTTVYWSPHEGNAVSLYDGTQWRLFRMSEIAIQLGTLTSGKGYDVFAFPSTATPSATDTGADTVDFASPPGWQTGAIAWVTATGGGLTAGTPYFINMADTDTCSFHTTLANALAGTSKVDLTASITDALIVVSLELSAAWASDTARTDALTTQDGFAAKSGATTRLHLGGFYTTATTTTEDSEDSRFLDNRYNLVDRYVAVNEPTSSWTYTTATYRYWNNNSANQIQVFNTVGARSIALTASLACVNTSASVRRLVAIGLDSGSSRSAYSQAVAAVPPASESANPVGFFDGPISLGWHYLSALEWSVATGTTTWYGYGTTSSSQMSGKWMC